MSWSVGVPATPATEFAAAVEAATAPEYFGAGEDQEALKVAQHEQIAAAKRAALAIWRSGVVGATDDPSVYLAASLSGHANAGLGGNDAVNVSVYQTYPPRPEPPRETEEVQG